MLPLPSTAALALPPSVVAVCTLLPVAACAEGVTGAVEEESTEGEGVEVGACAECVTLWESVPMADTVGEREPAAVLAVGREEAEPVGKAGVALPLPPSV